MTFLVFDVEILFLTFLSPFELSSTASLDRIERGLSERSEFRSDRSKLKRAEQPKANDVGAAFLWFVSFAVKRNELAHEVRKTQPTTNIKSIK